MPRTATLLAATLLAAPAAAQQFSFVALGDMRYGQPTGRPPEPALCGPTTGADAPCVVLPPALDDDPSLSE